MSYAVHPARSVALKNGDCRYHGPKYSVALLASISSRSLTIEQPPESSGPGDARRSRVEASFRGRRGCKSTDAASRAGRLNAASGNGDVLRRIHEGHRGDGGGPRTPLGLHGHGLALVATARREPAVPDVQLQTRRVDRRRDLADLLPIDRCRPLHRVEGREGVAVEDDTVDLRVDPRIADRPVRTDRDARLGRDRVQVDQPVQAHLEGV